MRFALIGLFCMFFSLVFSMTLPAQSVQVGNIFFDRNEWGSREVYIPIDNLVDDTARVIVSVQTVYPKHYLSGLERLEVDTMVKLPPNDIAEVAVPFKIHGSFERVVTRVKIEWFFDNYETPPNEPDSTFQIFNNVFRVHGEGAEYSDRKHSVGPVYSVMEHYQLNFEYPRLVLFLLARGKGVEEISEMFEADIDYTHEIIEDFRAEGFFPLKSDRLAPAILAIGESEGYRVKTDIKKVSDAFKSWYDETGRGEMKALMTDAGIDQYTGQLPGIQMAIWYALLMGPMVDKGAGIDIPHFENISYDHEVMNRTHWIVQGGEFFLPRRCLAVFTDKDRLNLSTFRPDPSLPFDKAPIYDMRRKLEKEAGSVTTLEAAQIRAVIEAAGKKKSIREIVDRIGGMISADEGKAALEYYQPYQSSCWADYVVRNVLGDCFADNGFQGVDAVRVVY